MLIKILLAVMIGMITPNLNASNIAPSDSFLFEGRVFNGEKNISGVSVGIYLNNNKVASALTNRYGIFKVFLKHNQTYTFEFSKLGFIKQRIQLSTRVSEKLINEGGIGEAFDNDFEILEYYEGVNTDIFNNPIRYFVYNEASFFFEEEQKKSTTVRINAVKTEIVQVKDKIASNELKKGDDFFQQQKYVDATIAYYRALELNPSRDIENKILATRKKMREQMMFEGNYKENIIRADELFKLQQYFDAKEKYKMALAMKPEDPYPSNQIIIIDSLINLHFHTNKQEYDKLIVVADSYYKDNMLKEALRNYESALALQVDTIYPRKQIDTIKAALTAEKGIRRLILYWLTVNTGN